MDATRTRWISSGHEVAGSRLETIIESGLGEPVTGRRRRRAAALGHQQALPEQGPTYISIIAPELTASPDPCSDDGLFLRGSLRPRWLAPWTFTMPGPCGPAGPRFSWPPQPTS